MERIDIWVFSPGSFDAQEVFINAFGEGLGVRSLGGG
jgi:hypothetical protein